MVKQIKRVNFLLIFILIVAAFFRFYNFLGLQYWSGDEEVLTATVRHIVWDKSPSLIVQNANLGFGLGPYYMWFLSPLFYLFNFNVVALLSIASLTGIATTYLVYLGAKELGSKRIGLLASFFYASSFFISIFDRRLFHLTLDPILSVVTFLALVKIIKKDYRFIPLLAIPIGFSFHSDASLIILDIAIFATWVIFRLPILRKELLYFVLIIFLFLLPLGVAQVRYKGAVIGPIIKSLTRPVRGENITSIGFHTYSPGELIGTFSRVIFTTPSNFIEEHFFYSPPYPPPLFGNITKLFVIIISVISLAITLRKKRSPHLIIWIMFLSFISGILIFNLLFKGKFVQHYSMSFFPIFTIMLGQTANWIYDRNKAIVLLFLTVYLSVNLYTLFNSSVRYPLNEKIKLVKSAISTIGKNNYAIYSSPDSYIQGGGWTELFTLQKHPSVKSYWYDYWDWIYQAYSLFPGPIQKQDPEKIVWIQKTDEPLQSTLPIISKSSYKDINIYVFDNNKIN